MRLSEIADMLDEIGIPVAYRAFEKDDVSPPPAPPFICYLLPDSNPEIADDINYAKIEELDIELYTNFKDFELENTIENVLTSHDIAFTREETYLSDERVQMTTFITEVLINGSE